MLWNRELKKRLYYLEMYNRNFRERILLLENLPKFKYGDKVVVKDGYFAGDEKELSGSVISCKVHVVLGDDMRGDWTHQSVKIDVGDGVVEVNACNVRLINKK